VSARISLDGETGLDVDKLKLARSLAIEIKHVTSHCHLTSDEQEAVRRAAELIVELLAEKDSESGQVVRGPAR
jgi:hypothetical protein